MGVTAFGPEDQVGGGGGAGASDTKEATQLLVKAAVESLNTKMPTALSTIPDNLSLGMPIRIIGEDVTACSFADVGSGLLTTDMTQRVIGTGVGVSQASSNLLITTGTTVNAEYLARSVISWRGALLARYKVSASQRIANQNLAFLLADLVGEGLSCTINSATSITVTKVGHGYTAYNVGQFMMIGAIVGAAGVPGRYAIASVPTANTINFTVAGWPASGTCVVDVFGHTYIRNLYNGTTATNSLFDTQRKGWANGDTTATIQTTVSPGHMASISVDGRNVYLGDTLVASSTAPNIITRASKFENIPDDNLSLYLFIWSYNGTAAPATTTTWTVGFWAVEKFANLPVYLGGNRMQGSQAPMPMLAISGSTTAVTGSLTSAGTTTATPATPTASILSSAATTNGTVVKATAGTIYGFVVSNTGAANAFFKLHNSATVTVGTTAVALTVTIAPSTTVSVEYGALGMRYGTGICYSITNLVADNDTTAVALNQVKVNLAYI